MTTYGSQIKIMIVAMMAAFFMTVFFIMPTEVNAEEQTEVPLSNGVTIISENVSNSIYNINDGKAIAVKGSNNNNPIVIENCIFNITESTMMINGTGVGYNGETKTKFGIAGNVIFKNVIINVNEGSASSSGNDAAITMFDGNIDFDSSTIDVKNWTGQGIGFYGKANVEFKDSILKNTGNKNGWCYAMYGSSVMTLDNTDMSATGMTKKSGNINVFYSGDSSVSYDAIYIKNGSTIDFCNNKTGGFALNYVKIHIEDSEINVSNNAGNATNSGKWFVKNSKITIAGNKNHGWSHQYDIVKDSEINIIHNGYAGYFITGKSTWENSKINIRCNGEKLKKYSGTDLTLRGNVLTLKDCGVAWIGAVGNSGKVVTEGNTKVVSYDIDESGLKNDSTAVLTGASMALSNIDKDGHVLFLNPKMEADYARGFDKDSDDVDLMENTNLEGNDVKIGKLTEAQLSHHEYDWNSNNPEDIIRHATKESYGVKQIKCKVCNEYISNSDKYKNGSNCKGTFVYAPLVAVEFNTNRGDETTNSVEELTYGEKVAVPKNPVREGYEFKGWFLDKNFDNKFDFDTQLTDSYTVLYAKWEEVENVIDNTNTPVTPRSNPTNGGTTGGGIGGEVYSIDDTSTTSVIVDDNKPTVKRLEDTKPPLAGNDHWALLNLLLTIFTVIMSVVLIGLYFKSKKDDEEAYVARMENRQDTRAIKKRGIPRILSAVWAVFMVIVFFITEDMTLPMRFTDEWTWLMVIMAIMQLCIAVLCKKVYDNDRDEPIAMV